MKKLLLLLFLIPNLALAGVCSLSSFVKEPTPGEPNYVQEVVKKMGKRGCKRNDVLELTVWAPNQGKNIDGAGNSTNYVSEGVIYGVAAEKCNFKQTIMYDTEGGMHSLVCVIK